MFTENRWPGMWKRCDKQGLKVPIHHQQQHRWRQVALPVSRYSAHKHMKVTFYPKPPCRNVNEATFRIQNRVIWRCESHSIRSQNKTPYGNYFQMGNVSARFALNDRDKREENSTQFLPSGIYNFKNIPRHVLSSCRFTTSALLNTFRLHDLLSPLVTLCDWENIVQRRHVCLLQDHLLFWDQLCFNRQSYSKRFKYPSDPEQSQGCDFLLWFMHECLANCARCALQIKHYVHKKIRLRVKILSHQHQMGHPQLNKNVPKTLQALTFVSYTPVITCVCVYSLIFHFLTVHLWLLFPSYMIIFVFICFTYSSRVY